MTLELDNRQGSAADLAQCSMKTMQVTVPPYLEEAIQEVAQEAGVAPDVLAGRLFNSLVGGAFHSKKVVEEEDLEDEYLRDALRELAAAISKEEGG